MCVDRDRVQQFRPLPLPLLLLEPAGIPHQAGAHPVCV